MRNQDYKYTVLRYIEKVNDKDIDGLLDMMTEDFHFVDTLGGTVEGRSEMKEAWTRYFNMFPDYTINVFNIMKNENTIAIVGTAKGTYAVGGELREENSWEIPAAWKAIVRDDKLSSWRVFSDNQPVREIIEKYRE
ncbi:nuclear transport factor 2 family protein [candidate division KSB1 bacterium]